MSLIAALAVGAETLDRRVLGGFRLVDSMTGKTVTEGMNVAGAGLRIRSNRSGIWAVLDAPGMTPITNDFYGTATPLPPQKFTIQVSNPANNYLPRQATLTLPAPLGAVGSPGVFTPQTVTLFAGPGTRTGINWAKLRLSIVKAGTAEGLGYAIVQVTNTATAVVLATGMTDLRGEALVAVAGLGVMANAVAGGAVMQKTTAVSIAAFCDTTHIAQPAGWMPDPDEMLLNLKGSSVKSATQAAQLSPGTSQSFTLPIPI